MATKDFVTAKQLCQTLQISNETFKLLRSKGLPAATKRGRHPKFDPAEVDDWFKIAGLNHDGTENLMFDSVVAITRRLGINRRTYFEWQGSEGFPIRDDDQHSLVDVLQWLVCHKPNSTSVLRFRDRFEDWGIETPVKEVTGALFDMTDPKTELTATRTERAKFELQKAKGDFILVEEAIRFYSRTVSSVLAILNELDVRVLASLPATASDDLRDIVQRVVRKGVDESKDAIRELIDGDQDERVESDDPAPGDVDGPAISTPKAETGGL